MYMNNVASTSIDNIINTKRCIASQVVTSWSH